MIKKKQQQEKQLRGKKRSFLSSFNILGILGRGYSRVPKVLTSNVICFKIFLNEMVLNVDLGLK